MSKYIFVTGGVCSGLGKVSPQPSGEPPGEQGVQHSNDKDRPYINMDAGTMNPYQPGKAYVTDDGAETDLDLGNYSRFTSSPLGHDNSITTGRSTRP